MAIPRIDIYQDGGLAGLLNFGSRPLGGSSPAQEIAIWNDYPQTSIDESLGVGNGVTASFDLDHGHLFNNVPLEVRVAGSSKTEVTDYTVNRVAGQITFNPGKIPTAGQSITASYAYGTGAGTAADVYLLARRRETFIAAGNDYFELKTSPSRVYEVIVNDAAVSSEDYGFADNVVYLDDTPDSGAIVVIIYEDESCTLQMIQVKSSGVEDPFSQSPGDDDEDNYVGIGGTGEITEDAIGNGDDNNTIFSLTYPCVIESTVVVKVEGVAVSNYLLDPIRGEIEFDAPVGNGDSVTADYVYYKTHKIGAIPPACARLVQTRGHAATTATQAIAEAALEVWAV